MRINSFSTFWHGSELSAMEMACLKSFVRQGHDVYLYSYAPLKKLPEGVMQKDAADIVDESYLHKFIVFGKPSIAHFSDFFRLKLFKNSDTVWIDTDVVLMDQPFVWDIGKRLFAKEQADSVCNAIIYIPSNDPALDVLIAKAEGMAGKPIAYGATGKNLIMDYLGHQVVLDEAGDASKFYPVHFDEFWKVFLPECREECENLCENAMTLHLWNNIIEKLGIWKEIGPSKGSYLENIFSDMGLMEYYDKVYPEKVARLAIRNYLHADIGLLTLAKLTVSSFRNSYQRIANRNFKKVSQCS